MKFVFAGLSALFFFGLNATAQSLESPNPKAAKAVQLSLEQAVATALQNSITIVRARNDVEMSGAQLIQAYGQFLPSVSVSVGTSEILGTTYVTASTPVVVSGQSYGSSLQVSSNYNIFDGKASRSELNSALAKKSASSLSLERAKQQITLDVTQSFLQIILNHQIVEFAKKNLEYSKQRQTQLATQTRVGQKNKFDLYRQQAQTSADEYFYINSKNQERNSELSLLRKLRLEVTSSYDFIEPKHANLDKNQITTSDESQLIQTALANRPDISAAEKLVSAAEWEKKSATSGNLPRLDVNLSALSNSRIFAYQSVSNISVTPSAQDGIINQLGNQISYSVGLSLTWNILDRDLAKANIAKTNIVESNARLDLNDRRNQVTSEVRQAYGNIQTARSQVEATHSGLISAEKAFEFIQARFDMGTANFSDLINAQGALIQAESLHAQAQINLDLQAQIIKTALGI